MSFVTGELGKKVPRVLLNQMRRDIFRALQSDYKNAKGGLLVRELEDLVKNRPAWRAVGNPLFTGLKYDEVFRKLLLEFRTDGLMKNNLHLRLEMTPEGRRAWILIRKTFVEVKRELVREKECQAKV